MTNINLNSVDSLKKALEQRKISSLELVTEYLNRIQANDKTINSFITILPECAKEQAKKADASRAKGLGPSLSGIPFSHKDIFCTEGVKTSCGSKMLDNFIAPYDATVTSKLFAEGMIMLGKTNMDEFAMGSSNENSFYGAVKNPINPEHVAGGSSGGSAAAVASGFTPVATGTDTGGSIRQPAAFCGITGLKPTYGRVSRYGMIAFASSLDQGGPFGHSAMDCAHLLKVMAGFDPKDSTSVDEPVPDYPNLLNQPLNGLKIGIPKEFFDERLDPSLAQVIESALKQYQALGATLVDISLPSSELAIPAYYIIAPAECSSNLARFDGVRYGYRCEDPKDLQDLYERTRSEAFGSEVKRRILVGTYALSSGYYDAYYLQAQKVRRIITQEYQDALHKVDVIMGPTTPTVAFKLGNKQDPVSMYLSDIYTTAVNLAGLPALSLPCGQVNGLPVGMQIIGNYFDEVNVLNAAHQFQLHTEGGL